MTLGMECSFLLPQDTYLSLRGSLSTSLPQEMRKTANKQPNLTPKRTRKITTRYIPFQLKLRDHLHQLLLSRLLTGRSNFKNKGIKIHVDPSIYTHTFQVIKWELGDLRS